MSTQYETDPSPHLSDGLCDERFLCTDLKMIQVSNVLYIDVFTFRPENTAKYKQIMFPLKHRRFLIRLLKLLQKADQDFSLMIKKQNKICFI